MTNTLTIAVTCTNVVLLALLSYLVLHAAKQKIFIERRLEFVVSTTRKANEDRWALRDETERLAQGIREMRMEIAETRKELAQVNCGVQTLLEHNK
jgi:septal ring factor EnvC (AmiA/AmiB activator)